MRSVTLFVILLSTLMGGCQRGGQKKIAVIPKGTSHIFWMSVKAGADAAGKEFHVGVEWQGPAQETEYARQIQIVDSMINRHVDGIALAASERDALVGPVDRAAAAHIPVVVFDSGINGGQYASFIATNNYEGGVFAGRELGKLLNGKGSVAMIMHAPGSNSTMDREKGFQDTIKKDFPGIQIVAGQFSMADPAKGRDSMENILSAHPDLNGVFASSEPSSVGAALALKSRGLSGKVKFVAFDASEGLIQDLKGGTIDALIAQDPYKMGFEAVKTVVDVLNGQHPPHQIDLHARVITKADLNDPEVQKLLKPI